MGFEMIDRDQRLLLDQRDCLGRGQADDHAADQPGAGGGGDGVDGAVAAPGLRHGPGDDQVERLDMGAGGDLGNHAAESRVLADLRQHDIGQDLAAAVLKTFHHRRGGFVAGCLDPEDDHFSLRPSLLHGWCTKRSP
jgi:hypothetical protein